MREKRFREYCQRKGLAPEAAARSIAAVQDIERYARRLGHELDSLDLPVLEAYIAELVEAGANTEETLDALLMYMRATERTELAMYLDGLWAGREVVPSIAERLESIAGSAARERVFGGLALPPLGSHQRALTALTPKLLARLRAEVGDGVATDVLAGNHHGIPAGPFASLREIYFAQGIDAALAHRHRQLVATLEEHARSGRPWFEQIVTPDFVEHVRGNQEIGAGVRDGDRILFAKVPYAPQQYLDEQDDLLKRYYMCHCPLARESIIDQTLAVDPMLCHCSAGFTAVAFEVIFGQPVEVEVLETALAGQTRCRFAVRIPAQA